MKKIIHITSLIIMLSTSVSFAQKGMTGIYVTTGDFLNGKLTRAGRETHIKLHELPEKDYLQVKCKDSCFLYLKKDVYGYRDKEGYSYRFYNGTIFPIVNPSETILFYRKISGTGMKNSPIIETYFFSKEAGTEILALTIANLQKAFASDKAFTTLLEIYYNTNNSLIEYDHIHNMYKLNRLLEISTREKNN